MGLITIPTPGPVGASGGGRPVHRGQCGLLLHDGQLLGTLRVVGFGGFPLLAGEAESVFGAVQFAWG